MRVPSRCSHAYGMLWEDDFCCCRLEGCGQRWVLGERGWQPIVNNRPYKPEYQAKKKQRKRTVPRKGTNVSRIKRRR